MPEPSLILVQVSSLLSFTHKQHLSVMKLFVCNTKTKYREKELCNGLYHYFGIVSALGKTLSTLKCKLVNGSCLRLLINIDGLPLFKSSNLQPWQILSLLVTVPMKEPVVIGLFSGTKKPDSSIILLENVVAELAGLEKGFDFEEKRFTLRLESVM